MGDTVVLEYETQEAAPEALRPLLKKDEKSGKFTAKLAPDSKVDEFRTTNIERGKRIEELETKAKAFDGLDPEQARKDKAELAKLKAQVEATKAGTTPEEVQKLVDEKINSERATLKNQAEAASKKAEEAETKRLESEKLLNRLTVRSEVASAVSTIGGFVPHALDEAEQLVEREGTVRDGVVVFLDSAGGLIPGPDGKRPKTVADRLAETKLSDQKPYKPHWWAANVNGGGAAGGAGAGGAKTMSRAAFDALSDADRAARMKEGVKLTD